MNIDAWLGEAKKQIDALDAEIIALVGLSDILSSEIDRSFLCAHAEMEIPQRSLQKINQMLERRAAGEPLAYIIGEREFFGRMFRVNESVLIPRVDTEALIYLVQDLDLPGRPRFLEIGTGSGCIAVTLALEYPQAEVLATDISKKALEVAELNDVIHEGRIDLVESDLLENIDPEMDGNFDVLIANLPYVNPDWEWLDLAALQYEPQNALFAEEGGLALYHRLLQQLQEKIAAHNLIHHDEQDSTKLCHGVPWIKYLVFEADPCQHDDLVSLAEAYGWQLDIIEGYGLRFKVKQ